MDLLRAADIVSGIFFVSPGPLPLDDSPNFRQGYTRRTRDGIVCYFCGSNFDEEGAYAPCCLAATEWNQLLKAQRSAALFRALWRAD